MWAFGSGNLTSIKPSFSGISSRLPGSARRVCPMLNSLDVKPTMMASSIWGMKLPARGSGRSVRISWPPTSMVPLSQTFNGMS